MVLVQLPSSCETWGMDVPLSPKEGTDEPEAQ